MSHEGKWGRNVWLSALLTPTLGGGKWPLSFCDCFARGEADICSECPSSLVGSRANPGVCRRGYSLSPVGNEARFLAVQFVVLSPLSLRYVGCYVVRVCMICTPR